MLVRPYLSPIKTFTITQSAYANTTLETPVTIPLSDSVLYGRTLQASDFPTITGAYESIKFIERTCVYGYNNSGGAITVYWKIYLTPSGGTISTVGSGNSSVSNQNYFNVDCSTLNVGVGDLVQVSAWASSDTNVTVNGYEMHTAPTQIVITSKPVANVTETYVTETVTAGTGVLVASNCKMDNLGWGISGAPITITYNARVFTGTHGMFQYGRGDSNLPNTGSITSVTLANASQVPRMCVSHIPSSVTYRELLT